MSLRDMSVFAGGRWVNLNIFAACICYIVSDLSRIKARRMSTILITDRFRDTDIRQCTYTISHIG